MALMTCPECGNKVSSLAEKCIHCGFPLQCDENSDIIIRGYSIIKETEQARVDLSNRLKKYLDPPYTWDGYIVPILNN